MLIVFHAPNHTLTSGALQIRTWERAWNLAGTQYQMQAWDAVNDSSYGMFGSTYGGGDVDDTDLYTGLNTNTDAKSIG